jgi:hypothetical protein
VPQDVSWNRQEKGHALTNFCLDPEPMNSGTTSGLGDLPRSSRLCRSEDLNVSANSLGVR